MLEIFEGRTEVGIPRYRRMLERRKLRTGKGIHVSSRDVWVLQKPPFSITWYEVIVYKFMFFGNNLLVSLCRADLID